MDATNGATWLDPARVAAALDIDVATGGDWLEAVCAAEGVAWSQWRSDLTDDSGVFTPTDNVAQAATLAAVDQYRRRDTYGGSGMGADISGLGQLGLVPVYDPLIERLGGIGRYRRQAMVG